MRVFAKEKFRGTMEIGGRRGRSGVSGLFPLTSENRRRGSPCRAFASCLLVLGSGKNKAPSITFHPGDGLAAYGRLAKALTPRIWRRVRSDQRAVIGQSRSGSGPADQRRVGLLWRVSRLGFHEAAGLRRREAIC